MAPGMPDIHCSCGLLIIRGGILFTQEPTEHYYKDVYCKDCYITMLEKKITDMKQLCNR